ncbi:MAG: response regulator transcription factor [Actinobacteria bacterium]|nr:response regulator transcription factor [Actinomycetota bacterium]
MRKRHEDYIPVGVDVADVIMEKWEPTSTQQASRYMPIDPGTFGQLRILRIGDVELHLDGHRLVVRDTPVHLPHKEFVILQQLMNNAGRVVTRREFRDNVWGPDRTDVPASLEVHIRRIRAKIESDLDEPAYIRTVRGVGYIFDLPEDN